jgi:hypothetical protein
LRGHEGTWHGRLISSLHPTTTLAARGSDGPGGSATQGRVSRWGCVLVRRAGIIPEVRSYRGAPVRRGQLDRQRWTSQAPHWRQSAPDTPQGQISQLPCVNAAARAVCGNALSPLTYGSEPEWVVTTHCRRPPCRASGSFVPVVFTEAEAAWLEVPAQSIRIECHLVWPCYLAYRPLGTE